MEKEKRGGGRERREGGGGQERMGKVYEYDRHGTYPHFSLSPFPLSSLPLPSLSSPLFDPSPLLPSPLTSSLSSPLLRFNIPATPAAAPLDTKSLLSLQQMSGVCEGEGGCVCEGRGCKGGE